MIITRMNRNAIALFCLVSFILGAKGDEAESSKLRSMLIMEISHALLRTPAVAVVARPPDADLRSAAYVGHDGVTDFLRRFQRCAVHVIERIYGADDDPSEWVMLPADERWNTGKKQYEEFWDDSPRLVFLEEETRKQHDEAMEYAERMLSIVGRGQRPYPLSLYSQDGALKLAELAIAFSMRNEVNVFDAAGLASMVSPRGHLYTMQTRNAYRITFPGLETRKTTQGEPDGGSAIADTALNEIPLPYEFLADLRLVLTNLADHKWSLPGPYRTDEGRELAEILRKRRDLKFAFGDFGRGFRRDRIMKAPERPPVIQRPGRIYSVTGRLLDSGGNPIRGNVMVTGIRPIDDRRAAYSWPVPVASDDEGIFRWESDRPLPSKAAVVGLAEGYAATCVEFKHDENAAPSVQVRMQKGVPVTFEMDNWQEFNRDPRWNVNRRQSRIHNPDYRGPELNQQPPIYLYHPVHRLPVATVLPRTREHFFVVLPMLPRAELGEPVPIVPGVYRTFVLFYDIYHDVGEIEIHEPCTIRIPLEFNVDQLRTMHDFKNWLQYGSEKRVHSRLLYWLLDMQEEILKSGGQRENVQSGADQ